MACSPYGLCWKFRGLALRSLKPLRPWFDLIQCWLKETVGETPTLCEGVTAKADVVIISFLLCFKYCKYEEVLDVSLSEDEVTTSTPCFLLLYS